jgi:methionyl-tRNA formyltransferase
MGKEKTDVFAVLDGKIRDPIRRMLVADGRSNLVGETSEPEFDQIESSNAEVLVSAGYDHIIPESVLDSFERTINAHWSLLPYGRGENPNVWSIIDDHPAGVTIHEMVPDVDAGPIIAQREVPVKPDDTGRDLYERLIDEQIDLFASTWPAIRRGDYDTSPNLIEDGTHHRRSEFDELCELPLEKEMTMKKCINILRALTFEPYKNAYFEKDGQRYYVEINISEETE